MDSSRTAAGLTLFSHYGIIILFVIDNEFIMNILNDINCMSCPLKADSNTIVIGVLDLLCVTRQPIPYKNHFFLPIYICKIIFIWVDFERWG